MIQLYEMMQPFLSTAWGQVTAFAAAIATIWALAKGIGAFKRWVAVKYRAYTERRDSYKV